MDLTVIVCPPNCVVSVHCLNITLYMTLVNNAYIWRKYKLNLVSVPNISEETATCFLGKVGVLAVKGATAWIWPQLTDHTQYSRSRAQVVGAQQRQCENILFVTALRPQSQKLEHSSQEAMSTFAPCSPLRFAFLRWLGNIKFLPRN